MVTIHDIAKHLGINAATVSRALRDKPGVSAELKKKILETVKEMGYQPHMMASQLRTQSSNVIGLFLEEDWIYYGNSVADGVQSYAKKNGYHVLIWNASKVEDQKVGIDFFEQMRLAGIIFASKHADTNREVPESKLPIVLVNRLGGPNVTSIMTDDEHGATLAAVHLIGLGHKDIAMINGPSGSIHVTRRKKGVVEALRSAGLKLRDEWYFEGDWVRENGYESAKKLFAQKDRPTAIIAGNDDIALGVYDAALEYGVSIPDELSVIGYNDHISCQYMRPQLTTITLPLREMGMEAAKVLIQRLKQPQLVIDQRVVKGSLVIRGSTKALT